MSICRLKIANVKETKDNSRMPIIMKFKKIRILTDSSKKIKECSTIFLNIQR
jgi:hypothetical protein